MVAAIRSRRRGSDPGGIGSHGGCLRTVTTGERVLGGNLGGQADRDSAVESLRGQKGKNDVVRWSARLWSGRPSHGTAKFQFILSQPG